MAMTVKAIPKEEIKRLNMQGTRVLGRTLLIGGCIETLDNGERILRWSLDDSYSASVNDENISKYILKMYDASEIDGVYLKHDSKILRRDEI